jgi:hypothetical protein
VWMCCWRWRGSYRRMRAREKVRFVREAGAIGSQVSAKTLSCHLSNLAYHFNDNTPFLRATIPFNLTCHQTQPSLVIVGERGDLTDFLVLFLFKLNALLFLSPPLPSFSCRCSLCSRSSARRPQKSLPCAGIPYETFHLHSSNLTVCVSSMRLMRVSRCR